MTNHILIIDDDLKICTLLQKLFHNNNYIAMYALNAFDAKETLKYLKFDVLIVDYMMPEQNGIDFIKEIRKQNIQTPALMLTAIDELNNKLNALSNGLDDYLIKPFNSQELLLRIKNLIDRKNNDNKIVNTSNFIFNASNGLLKINNEVISLTTGEEELLKVLVNKANVVLSKEDILAILQKDINENNINALNVNIARLRKKIENNQDDPQYIKTIRNKGIMFIQW
jgi:two-component system phosphate regulon response regulator OmpR